MFGKLITHLKMDKVEIVGYKRTHFGKKEAKKLRKESYAPCILYNGKETVHFYAPMALFQELVYTPNAYFVDLNIEGKHYSCVLQDIQFHPVSEMILHADFLEISDDKPVRMDIPVVFTGNSPGIAKGGMLAKKLRKLLVKALPKDMPKTIEVDISSLELGKTVKVKEVTATGFEILNPPLVPIAMVEIPRALRSKAAQAQTTTEE